MTIHIFWKVYISLPNETLKMREISTDFGEVILFWDFFYPSSASNAVIGQMMLQMMHICYTGFHKGFSCFYRCRRSSYIIYCNSNTACCTWATLSKLFETVALSFAFRNIQEYTWDCDHEFPGWVQRLFKDIKLNPGWSTLLIKPQNQHERVYLIPFSLESDTEMCCEKLRLLWKMEFGLC